MPALRTTYLGLELKNPIVASSGPLTGTVAQARLLESAGVGAIVMRSVFEEQIRAEVAGMYDALAEAGSSAAFDYLRADLPMQLGPEKYVETLRALRKELKIPVIASINCIVPDQWVAFARKLERAGADALELNVYDIPVDPAADSLAVENRHLALVRAIEAEVKLPVAVKLSPFYTGMAGFARRLNACNVEGLVLFNRFLQPDIDIETMTLKYGVHYSHPDDLRLPLRWVAILRDQITCDLALSSGVHDAGAAIKALLAGANAVYMCSALFAKPEGHVVAEVLQGMREWMARHGFGSLDDCRGRLRERVLGDGQGFERAHYVKTLSRT
ncbi:MAG: dihydroorotate dehydrogenase-like protein [Kiritimatiellae bacterium]|nr:dihydroorotate dehydrogenase-like protein [Kiritimatiellia bacterium]